MIHKKLQKIEVKVVDKENSGKYILTCKIEGICDIIQSILIYMLFRVLNPVFKSKWGGDGWRKPEKGLARRDILCWYCKCLSSLWKRG